MAKKKKKAKKAKKPRRKKPDYFQEQVKDIEAKVEKLMREIAEKRDELREVLGFAEQLLENCDSAEHEMESAVRSLQDAADKISETV